MFRLLRSHGVKATGLWPWRRPPRLHSRLRRVQGSQPQAEFVNLSASKSAPCAGPAPSRHGGARRAHGECWEGMRGSAGREHQGVQAHEGPPPPAFVARVMPSWAVTLVRPGATMRRCSIGLAPPVAEATGIQIEPRKARWRLRGGGTQAAKPRPGAAGCRHVYGGARRRGRRAVLRVGRHERLGCPSRVAPLASSGRCVGAMGTARLGQHPGTACRMQAAAPARTQQPRRQTQRSPRPCCQPADHRPRPTDREPSPRPQVRLRLLPPQPAPHSANLSLKRPRLRTQPRVRLILRGGPVRGRVPRGGVLYLRP